MSTLEPVHRLNCPIRRANTQVIRFCNYMEARVQSSDFAFSRLERRVAFLAFSYIGQTAKHEELRKAFRVLREMPEIHYGVTRRVKEVVEALNFLLMHN